jgi:hypothetical protein
MSLFSQAFTFTTEVFFLKQHFLHSVYKKIRLLQLGTILADDFEAAGQQK